MTYLGVLIDPFARTVEPVELPNDTDTEAMAKLVDGVYFDGITLLKPEEGSPGAVLYLDEDRYGREPQAFWSFSGKTDEIFAGKGVVVAINTSGEMTSGVSHPDYLATRVVWRDVRYVGVEDKVEDGLVRKIRKYEPQEPK
jgi:hypothetical protein